MKIIQIAVTPTGTVLALTNRGTLYERATNPRYFNAPANSEPAFVWRSVPLPDMPPEPETLSAFAQAD